MSKRVVSYIFKFLLVYFSFVISLSLKKKYDDFMGIPFYVYVILFSLLVVIGLVQFLRKRKIEHTSKN